MIVICLALVYRRIFYGLSVTSKVYLDRVMVSITPYDSELDQLSILGDNSDQPLQIVGKVSINEGTLVISNPGTQQLTAADWNAVINYPAYRLNMDVSF